MSDFEPDLSKPTFGAMMLHSLAHVIGVNKVRADHRRDADGIMWLGVTCHTCSRFSPMQISRIQGKGIRPELGFDGLPYVEPSFHTQPTTNQD